MRDAHGNPRGERGTRAGHRLAFEKWIILTSKVGLLVDGST